MSETPPNSSDIGTKIRSAIKAKLMELGAYVDEELPDYIMVMIANKKSKQQMSDDLNLFLGKNSASFTDWLHGVLDRLQAISRSSASAAIAQVITQSVAGNEMMSKEERVSSKNKGDNISSKAKEDSSALKTKEITSKTKETISSKTRETISSKEKGENISSKSKEEPASSRAHKEKERKRSPARKRQSSPRHSDTRNSRQRSRHERKKISSRTSSNSSRDSNNKRGHNSATKDISGRHYSGDVEKSRMHETGKRRKSTSPKSAPQRSRQADMNDDDILVVRAEIDEGDELASGENTFTRRDDQSERVVSIVDNTSSPSITISSNRKPIEAPSPDAPGYRRRHVGTVRPMKRRTPSPSEVPSRKRRSTVGQVVHRPRSRYDDDDGVGEEYDPLRPQLHPSNTLSSTVHVTERKYNVPREMQPKPSIFLRALNEANRSVKTIPSNIVAEKHDENRRKRRVEDEGNVDRAGGVFGRVGEGIVKEDPPMDEEFPASDRPRKRLIQLRQPANDDDLERKPTAEEDDHCVVIDDSRANGTKDRGPRFVVTMSGVDRKFVHRMSKEEPTLHDQEVQEDDSDTLIVDVTEQELMEEAMMAQEEDTANSPSVRFGLAATPAKQVVNPIKISLEDDEDDDDMAEEAMDTVVVSSGSQTGSIGGAVPFTSPAIDETVQFFPPLDDTLRGGRKPVERCQFWPNCKFGSICQFHHPTVSCKNFPQCRFGDKCLYTHPPCKFGAFCKNPQCPYSHNRSTEFGQMMRPSMVNFGARFPSQAQTPAFLTACKFGGRCLNQLCPFRHPQTPCMYGSACTKPTCAYSHRPIPTLSQPMPPVVTPRLSAPKVDVAKFRWCAAQTTTPAAPQKMEPTVSASRSVIASTSTS